MFACKRLSFGCVIALALVCYPDQLGAQNDWLRKSDQAVKDGNRLLAIELAKKGIEETPFMNGLLPQMLPLISDYEPTRSYEEMKSRQVQNKDSFEQLQDQVPSLQQLDAIEAIVKLAKENQVVILNEAHDMPQHRAFGHLLAVELRKAGYEFMAMETLVGTWGFSGRVRFEYPTLKTGQYSREPVFGDFVRQTSQAGFKLIAYEIEPAQRAVDAQSDPTNSIIEREAAQSDNLIEHIFEKQKDAKVFIYVGYAHATEDWQTLDDGRELGWMAAQLRRKTGIDPLTIDQVGGTYNPKGDEIDPVFKLIQSKKAIEHPSVFRTDSGNWISSDQYQGKTDLTVFHPIQTLEAGRPDWLRMSGYRKPFVVANEAYFLDEKTLVQAFLASEGKDALPVDQLLLDSAEGSSTFLLPAGTYRTRSTTAKGEVRDGPTIELAE